MKPEYHSELLITFRQAAGAKLLNEHICFEVNVLKLDSLRWKNLILQLGSLGQRTTNCVAWL